MSFSIDWHFPASDNQEDIAAADRSMEFIVSTMYS